MCVPLQKGGVPVRLHPHSATVLRSARVNSTGSNAVPLCMPLQNGCVVLLPHLHHA